MYNNDAPTDETPDVVGGYRKDRDDAKEIEYLQDNDDGRITHVRAVKFRGAWYSEIFDETPSGTVLAKSHFGEFPSREAACEALRAQMERFESGLADPTNPLSIQDIGELIAASYTGGQATYFHRHLELQQFGAGIPVWTVRPAGGDVVDVVNMNAAWNAQKLYETFEHWAQQYSMEVDNGSE